MPFFSPGSSGLTIAPPPAPPAPAVVDKLAELSADEPLPQAYAADRIRLLTQSPRRLYLYWEFSRNPYETLRRAFRWQADRYTLAVRLVDQQSGVETFHMASPTRSQWFDARQGHAYRADVGFYAQGRPFIRLLSSDTTRTPRAGVSHRADMDPEFSVSPIEFAQVLDDAGYVSDALEVSLEAADAAGGNDASATQAVARQLSGGADLPLMSDDELAELRGLIAALAMGVDLDELRAIVSVELAHWLERIMGERREALNAAHLVEILRSTLGIEMEATGFDVISGEAMRRPARFVVGASEVNLPLKPFHIWLPSMMGGRKGGTKG